MALPRKPLVHVETLSDPRRYTTAQHADAFRIAYLIQRGRLVYCIPPERDRGAR